MTGAASVLRERRLRTWPLVGVVASSMAMDGEGCGDIFGRGVVGEATIASLLKDSWDMGVLTGLNAAAMVDGCVG